MTQKHSFYPIHNKIQNTVGNIVKMTPKKLAIVILSLVAANLAFAENLLIETEFGKVKDRYMCTHEQS